MQFLIADSFTDSLARLSTAEQKAVKTSAFDLQMDPSGKGLSFHKLDNAKDKRFWSVRASSDIRLIVHRSDQSLLLCYVDHHDKAYAWAERRKLETHPTTGAAQLVEIRERVEEIPVYVQATAEAPVPAAPVAKTKPAVLRHLSDEELLGYGVPPEWIADAKAADEDGLLVVIDHLPAEAGEALLELATGGHPKPAQPQPSSVDPFAHPDAQRRFRTVEDAAALEQAFAYPWEKWIIFLHPAQRLVVERAYGGPARASGSAGTGKSIVALHRAVWLARADEDARVLLTTFSEPLANALRDKLARLVSATPKLADRIEVHALPAIAERLATRLLGPARIADEESIRVHLAAAMQANPTPFKPSFLMAEWRDLVDAWQVADWPAYRDIKRLGRKTRLNEAQRKQVWQVLDDVRTRLRQAGLVTASFRYTALSGHLAQAKTRPFDAVVVDECQDLSVAQLRFLAALGSTRAEGLFFTGDLGQRIFQLPFSWKSLGVDIRGRSQNLRVNYRTSHQIRRRADMLLDPEIADVDGNTEDRRGAQSVFNGPDPVVSTHPSEAAEQQAVAVWLCQRLTDGVAPREIAIFVRSEAQLGRASAAAKAAGLSHAILDQSMSTTPGAASIGTMHLAKGLEFRAIVVMACDDEILPLQDRIDEIGDDADLEEVYHTERHLLYVACTRARDFLFVSGVEPASEFLADFTDR